MAIGEKSNYFYMERMRKIQSYKIINYWLQALIFYSLLSKCVSFLANVPWAQNPIFCL